MDIFPTVLELVDAPKPDNHILDGTDLGPLLSGKDDYQRDETFLMHFPHKHRSSYFTVYREGDWKLIYHYFPDRAQQPDRYQLFNLKDDLSESNNLAKSKPEKLQDMIQAMAERLEMEGALYAQKGEQVMKPQQQMP